MCRLLAILLISIAAVTPALRLHGQASSDQKSSTFDVASVKPNSSQPNPASARFTVQQGGRLLITSVPLRGIIQVAYQVPDYQLIGGPDWIRASRFDIVATAEGMPVLRFPPGFEAPSHPVYPMLRALLTDRFKLVVHHETRTLPMYALVLAKSDGTLGSQLHRSTTDCASVNAARGTAAQGPPVTTQNGAPQCGMVGGVGPGGIRLTADSQAMSVLISTLSGYAGRPVVDGTGLTGLLSFTLEFALDQPPSGQQAPDSSNAPRDTPSLVTAVQEQLGLKLESRSGPADVVVIDHVEQPTPD